VKAALLVSVFLLAGILSNGNTENKNYTIKQDAADTYILSLENNLADFITTCDLEKDADEKEKEFRYTLLTHNGNEYSIARSCINLCIFSFTLQIPVLITRIDLPPPSFC